MRTLCLLACLAGCTFSTIKASVDADEGSGSDSGGGGQWVVVETLTVPADGTAVPSTTVLATGVGYRLRAMGTCYVKIGAFPWVADAEFFGFNSGGPMDAISGVDIGLGVNDAVVDFSRTPRWGAYTSTHIYEVPWTGDGAVISAKLHDGNYTDNMGELTLQILALQ